MNLSNELISQFVKATKDDRKSSTETTVNGTTVEYGGKIYVKLDGSDLLTPVRTTADVKPDERVTVMIKDHTATVTGNISSPAARTDDVKDIANQITEFEILVAHKVSVEELEATNAVIQNLRAKLANIDELHAVFVDIENLEAKLADIEYLNATDIKAITANIEKIQAHFGTFTDLSTEELEALYAEIETLKGYTADFTYLSTDALEALRAEIKELDTTKLSAEQADIKYANIDFANIGEAAIEKLFTESGIIKDIIVSDGKITGELIGVTIKGDLIEAGTLKADRLVIKGSDGKYYKLNTDFTAMPGVEPVEEDSIHGSTIVANSVTAEKIAVDDLVAFDATIGGFKISTHSLYSGVKESIDNTTMGVYLDDDGQLSVGDSNNFLRYFKDENGNYKLEISASSLKFSASGKSIEETIDEKLQFVNNHTLYESISELIVDSSEIKASVANMEKTVDTLSNDVLSAKTEIASMKLESDDLRLAFQSISDDGITKITTETGFTFDREGMSIDSTDSPTKTHVTPDGMTVYRKNAEGVQTEVLEANSDGVNATNLHAKTYLIIGGRSRFENYGNDRTGCFWIGG